MEGGREGGGYRLGVAAGGVGLPSGEGARRVGLKEPRRAVRVEADDQSRNAEGSHPATLRVFLPTAAERASVTVKGDGAHSAHATRCDWAHSKRTENSPAIPRPWFSRAIGGSLGQCKISTPRSTLSSKSVPLGVPFRQNQCPSEYPFVKISTPRSTLSGTPDDRVRAAVKTAAARPDLLHSCDEARDVLDRRRVLHS
jgi:hypothetical protein